MFRKRVRVGASIYVAVSTPNAVGKVRRLKIVKKDVKGSNLCLPPGTVDPVEVLTDRGPRRSGALVRPVKVG